MGRPDAMLVLGGGPAGCAAAAGLLRAGYPVTVVSSERPFPALEGLGQRTVDTLATLGLERALQAVGPAVPRIATWNGETSSVNEERLTRREHFDRALREDARAAGARWIAARRIRIDREGEGWRVSGESLEHGTFQEQGVYLVEARGRGAPLRGHRLNKGPPTTALVGWWRTTPGRPPGTWLASFAKGWAWFAETGQGEACLQLMVPGAPGDLPGRSRLTSHYAGLLQHLPQAAEWLRGADGPLAVGGRGAGPVMVERPLGKGRARIGDAAVAPDPLSGQGIFYALGSALALPAVVNTLLNHPGRTGIVKRFVLERCEDAFLRTARTGRDHYRREARWPREPFWRERQAWPDDAPGHVPPQQAPAAIEHRPTVIDGLIEEREVMVSADHPRGIYHIDGVPLAPLCRYVHQEGLENASPEQAALRAARHLDRPPDQVINALGWLRFRGLW